MRLPTLSTLSLTLQALFCFHQCVAKPTGMSLQSLANGLQSVSYDMLVNVVLVGFEGNVNKVNPFRKSKSPDSVAPLQAFLEQISQIEGWTGGVSITSLNPATFEPKPLRVKQSIHFHVEEAPKPFASKLFSAFTKTIKKTPKTFGGSAILDSQVVTDILDTFPLKTKVGTTVFVISPPVNSKLRYQYYLGGNLSSYSLSKECGTSLRVVNAERYGWIDLRAGPFTIGSEGQEVVYNGPSDFYTPKGYNHAAIGSFIARYVKHTLLSPIIEFKLTDDPAYTILPLFLCGSSKCVPSSFIAALETRLRDFKHLPHLILAPETFDVSAFPDLRNAFFASVRGSGDKIFLHGPSILSALETSIGTKALQTKRHLTMYVLQDIDLDQAHHFYQNHLTFSDRDAMVVQYNTTQSGSHEYHRLGHLTCNSKSALPAVSPGDYVAQESLIAVLKHSSGYLPISSYYNKTSERVEVDYLLLGGSIHLGYVNGSGSETRYQRDDERVWINRAVMAVHGALEKVALIGRDLSGISQAGLLTLKDKEQIYHHYESVRFGVSKVMEYLALDDYEHTWHYLIPMLKETQVLNMHVQQLKRSMISEVEEEKLEDTNAKMRMYAFLFFVAMGLLSFALHYYVSSRVKKRLNPRWKKARGKFKRH